MPIAACQHEAHLKDAVVRFRPALNRRNRLRLFSSDFNLPLPALSCPYLPLPALTRALQPLPTLTRPIRPIRPIRALCAFRALAALSTR